MVTRTNLMVDLAPCIDELPAPVPTVQPQTVDRQVSTRNTGSKVKQVSWGWNQAAGAEAARVCGGGPDSCLRTNCLVHMCSCITLICCSARRCLSSTTCAMSPGSSTPWLL
jgi:hypothetical protein